MADTPCSYDFSGEHLQALWLEFQQAEAATCPETNAPITLELVTQSDRATEPTVQAYCARCGRRTSFRPGKLEGFGWAE